MSDLCCEDELCGECYGCTHWGKSRKVFGEMTTGCLIVFVLCLPWVVLIAVACWCWLIGGN